MTHFVLRNPCAVYIGYAHAAVIIQNDDCFFIANKRIEQGINLITSDVIGLMLRRSCIVVKGI